MWLAFAGQLIVRPTRTIFSFDALEATADLYFVSPPRVG
jgi:hypothetical protein